MLFSFEISLFSLYVIIFKSMFWEMYSRTGNYFKALKTLINYGNCKINCKTCNPLNFHPKIFRLDVEEGGLRRNLTNFTFEEKKRGLRVL